MNIKEYGFTLAELLIAMVILGVIAALTIPALLSNVFAKSFVAQAKNTVATIEQLAADELVNHKTRFLSSTDFADPDKLLKEGHFEYSKKCKIGTECPQAQNYFTITNHDNAANPFTNGAYCVMLNNGILLSYTVTGNDNQYGRFVIDVNGADKPNIIGRDVYAFDIDEHGHIVNESGATEAGCKGGNAIQCTTVLMNNSWNAEVLN